MAYHQNTSVATSKLILGNYKIESAATSAGTYTNLGAGKVNSFAHNITMFDTQAGNAPDPIEGISDETFTVDFELLEFDSSALAAISCGAMTSTETTAQSTLIAGGNSTLTPRAFKFTNTRLISGSTKQTIITVPYATLSAGIGITAKGDEEGDPINVIPIQIVGKVDVTLSIGTQLFTITKDLTA